MTFKCQVACPHCIIEAGPQRSEEMTLTDTFNWIRQIAAYRQGHIRSLALTGGEHSLQEILDQAEVNPILHAIRIWGPHKLIALIQAAGLTHELPALYVKDSTCHACYDLMANPALVAFMHQLANDSTFIRKVAYGRVYYLNETRMVEILQNSVLGVLLVNNTWAERESETQ
jgi:hypothetical protein